MLANRTTPALLGIFMENSEVIAEKSGSCGLITLNRSKALNALTLRMIDTIADALDSWENDPDVKTIVVKSSSEKAFCAGADVKAIYELGKAGRHSEQMGFFAREYALNLRIARYPKPYVALMNGIVMGGGVGISIHGSHKVASENYQFAMPETDIGFFPDVGGSYFLPRMQGKLGVYLGLTAARLSAGDACAFGVADAFVPQARHASLLQRLIEGENADAALAAEKTEAPGSGLVGLRHFVDGCFAPQKLETILEDIDDAGYGGSAFALSTYETIIAKSPTSLALTLKLLDLGSKLDLEDALRIEYRVAAHCMKGSDYYEGVRAVLVDRDRMPKWIPTCIEELKPETIDAYFEPVEGEDLVFGNKILV